MQNPCVIQNTQRLLVSRRILCRVALSDLAIGPTMLARVSEWRPCGAETATQRCFIRAIALITSTTRPKGLVFHIHLCVTGAEGPGGLGGSCRRQAAPPNSRPGRASLRRLLACLKRGAGAGAPRVCYYELLLRNSEYWRAYTRAC